MFGPYSNASRRGLAAVLLTEHITLTAFHLPCGSTRQLVDSIHDKLLTPGGDATAHSGHGPDTTIGRARRTNPFLTGRFF